MPVLRAWRRRFISLLIWWRAHVREGSGVGESSSNATLGVIRVTDQENVCRYREGGSFTVRERLMIEH